MADIKKLPLFVRCVIQNFPFIEEDFDALTNYQLISKVVEYLNKIINSQNEVINVSNDLQQSFAELRDYVENYFDNLDVQDEVNNKLDEMAEDGTLARLINTSLEENLNRGVYNKTPYINYQRILRRLKKSSHNINVDESDYYTMQGGCYLGNNIFIQASIKGSSTKLEKFNLTTNELIESNVLSLGHCNSLTYDSNNNIIYATSLNDGVNQTHYLYKINPSNLTIIETIEFTSLSENEGLHSVAYDSDTNKTYIAVEYKTTNVLTIYELNSDNTLTNLNLINYKNILGPGGGSNDICVYKNILYILKHNPKTITTYDLVTKKVLQIYNLPLHNEFGYGIGEPENISYDTETGDIILGGYKLDCKNGWFYLHNYFRLNFEHGIQTALSFNEPNTYGEIEVTVDAASTSLNPTGTTSQPFNTIGEALEVLNRKSCKSLLINVRDGSYPYLYIIGTNNVRINALNTAADVTIAGVKIYNSDNISIIKATILDEKESHDFDLESFSSKILLTNIVFSGNHDAHMFLTQTTLHCVTLSSSVSGVMYKLGNDVILNPEENEPTLSMTDDSAVNAIFGKEIYLGSATLDATGHSISIANIMPYITSTNKKLRISAIALYGQATQTFTTQTTDGGNRNVCITIDSHLITIQVVFDLTNKTITPRITKCINAKSLTLTEDTVSGTYKLFLVP